MDPLTIAALVAGLVQAIIMAISKLGPEVWDKPLREIIPDKLRTSIEKAAADAAAAQKFGPAVPPPSPFVDDVD